jgi:flagellar assembly protein FliH
MTKIKFNQLKIKNEDSTSDRAKIASAVDQAGTQVEDYAFTLFKDVQHTDYSKVKQKYGPISPTDVERTERGQRDRRFRLNPLLRDPLSVEQEERRVIEEKVKVQIDQVAETARKKAEEEGYQEGLKKGAQDAYMQVRSEGAQILTQLEQVVKHLENAKAEIFAANERFLMEMIFRIARMLLLKEIAADPQYLLRLSRELITRIGLKENIKIKVPQNDLKAIETLRDDLGQQMTQLKNLMVEPSPEIQGGCIVETEWTRLDARIETQLQGIYESIVKSERRENNQ